MRSGGDMATQDDGMFKGNEGGAAKFTESGKVKTRTPYETKPKGAAPSARDLRLLDAGACWAWVAVMPPANGLGNIVEGRGFFAFRLAVEEAETELFVVALRASAARSLAEGGGNRASSTEKDDAAKDEQWPFHEGGSHHLSNT
jgi:hypothetical protein